MSTASTVLRSVVVVAMSALTAAACATSAGSGPAAPREAMREASTPLPASALGSRSPTDREKARARALFAQGNEALRTNDFPRAARCYREALTHWDHPFIHYNLALALVNLYEPIELGIELERARGAVP